MRTRSRMNKLVAAAAVLALSLVLQAVVIAPPEQAAAAAQGWYVQDPGDSGLSFQDISVVDANTAWAAARNGWVVKTTDGGSTWVRKRGLPGG